MSHVDEDHGKFLKSEKESVHASMRRDMIEILEPSYSRVLINVVSFEN